MKTKKIISIAICLLILLQSFSVNIFANDGGDNEPTVFEDSFDYDSVGADLGFYDANKTWETEFNNQNSEDVYGYRDSTTPTVSGGAMNFKEGDGVRLNWQKLDGFSTFDASKTYTITFDVKLTDLGDDKHLNGATAWCRDFYFAPAGYFNQIEIVSGVDRNTDAVGTVGIRAGDMYTDNAADVVLNKVYSCTVVWQPSEGKITTTVKDGSTVLATGSRTNNDYKTLNKYTSNWVWRCEDGAAVLDNVTFSDGTNTYRENFEAAEGSMAESGIWGLETVHVTGSLSPTLENGALKLSAKTGVRFNWTKVPGVSAFSAANIYTFDFDFKVTDSGNGNIWGGTEHNTRSLYVGFGGWYTLLSLPDKDSKIDVCYGSQKIDWTDANYLNKNLHATFIWSGTSIYCQVDDEQGNMIASGSRTSSDFTDMTVDSAAMTNLVLRCEDGAVEIDNFRFLEEKQITLESKALSIPASDQGVYTASLDYSGEGVLAVKLGTKSLFEITPSSMTVCTKGIGGSFGAGVYGIKAYINPDQHMVTVELTAPDGAIVRRGFYELLSSNTLDNISVYTTKSANSLKSSDITYNAVVKSSYTLTTTEPTYSGVEANIYNVVTSFSDAETTRSFAWTVKASFLGSDAMSLKYRAKGASAWTAVDAVKETEAFEVSDEDYFKCDISGLSANTEYEYRIGIKGSTDETNKWSKTYTFKTAAEDITSFSFIAVGDTQGITWGGTTSSDKGFMYSKVAYEQAFAELDDPAFILHTGDVVEWGGNKDMWNWYFKSLGGYGTSTPMFVAMGNHDTWRKESTENLFFDYHFNHPDNGGTAALDQTEIAKLKSSSLKYVAQNADETIYSYNYGDVHFIVLNTGGYDNNQDVHLIEAQRAWLINDLEANKDARWTVVLQHESVYHRLGGAEGRPYLHDVLEQYGVDLVIQGHSHLVTRTYPMKDGKIVTKSLTDTIEKGTGTIYTTIGSTALNHDGIDDSSNVEEMYNIVIPTAEQAAYTTVEVDEGNLVVTTKQLDGLVLDRFTITDSDIVKDDNNDNNDNNGNNDSNNSNNNNNNNNNNENNNSNNNNNNSNNNENNGNNGSNESNVNTEDPKVTTDATTSDDASDNGGDTAEKKGCGSSIGVSFVILATIGVACPAVLRRKRKE